jgi:hypothetical protein
MFPLEIKFWTPQDGTLDIFTQILKNLLGQQQIS